MVGGSLEELAVGCRVKEDVGKSVLCALGQNVQAQFCERPLFSPCWARPVPSDRQPSFRKSGNSRTAASEYSTSTSNATAVVDSLGKMLDYQL